MHTVRKDFTYTRMPLSIHRKAKVKIKLSLCF